VAGALAYQVAMILDNCDGEVARIKNLRSEFGGWLDVGVDFLTDLSLFLGLGLGLWMHHTQGPVLLFTLLCVSGAFLHLIIVVIEKTKGFGPAVFGSPNPDVQSRQNPAYKMFDALREGDASWLVLVFAVTGRTIYLLWAAGVYMQFLWVSALLINFRWYVKVSKS